MKEIMAVCLTDVTEWFSVIHRFNTNVSYVGLLVYLCDL